MTINCVETSYKHQDLFAELIFLLIPGKAHAHGYGVYNLMYRKTIAHRNSGVNIDNLPEQLAALFMPSVEGTRILVVDDDQALRNILKASLERSGYIVITASNGREAIEQFKRNAVDLVLMDIMMPVMDGLTACAELRELTDVPIIMLTALNRPDDIVKGFDFGADDYIAKPFTFREVEMRLLAILRRISWINDGPTFSVIAAGDIMLNDEEHQVTVRGEKVHLTPIEYQLLHHLMSVPNQPVSKDELFKRVWGYNLAGGTNLVEVAVRRLREKIEAEPSHPVYLLTVRGVGYKFNDDHVEQASPIRPMFEPTLACAA